MANPADSEKLQKWYFLPVEDEIWNFLGQMIAFEVDFIQVSGSVHVHVHVDKSE